MATKPFTAVLRGQEVTVCQNGDTGFFYIIRPDGKHEPVDYSLIRAQTTCMQRLKYWRDRYGYTQAELAKLVHVSSPTVIMMWENGLRHPREKYRKLLNTELSHDIFPD